MLFVITAIRNFIIMRKMGTNKGLLYLVIEYLIMNWYKQSQNLSVMEELGISTPKKYYLFDKNQRKLVPPEDSIEGESEQIMTEEQAKHANDTYMIGQWMTIDEIRDWFAEN